MWATCSERLWRVLALQEGDGIGSEQFQTLERADNPTIQTSVILLHIALLEDDGKQRIRVVLNSQVFVSMKLSNARPVQAWYRNLKVKIYFNSQGDQACQTEDGCQSHAGMESLLPAVGLDELEHRKKGLR